MRKKLHWMALLALVPLGPALMGCDEFLHTFVADCGESAPCDDPNQYCDEGICRDRPQDTSSSSTGGYVDSSSGSTSGPAGSSSVGGNSSTGIHSSSSSGAQTSGGSTSSSVGVSSSNGSSGLPVSSSTSQSVPSSSSQSSSSTGAVSGWVTAPPPVAFTVGAGGRARKVGGATVDFMMGQPLVKPIAGSSKTLEPGLAPQTRSHP